MDVVNFSLERVVDLSTFTALLVTLELALFNGLPAVIVGVELCDLLDREPEW
jgi:hypothetical protein